MNRKVRQPSLTFSPDLKELTENLPQMVRALERQLKDDPDLADYVIEEFHASSTLKIVRNGTSTKDWFKDAKTNAIVPLDYIIKSSLVPAGYTGPAIPVKDSINSRWLFCVFSNVFTLCQFQHIEDGRDQTLNIANSLSESILGMDAATRPQMVFGLGDIKGQGAYKEEPDYNEYSLAFTYDKATFQFESKVPTTPEFNLSFQADIPNYPYEELIKTGIWCGLLQVNAVHGGVDEPTAMELAESIKNLNAKNPSFAWKNADLELKAETLQFMGSTGKGVGFKICPTSDNFSSEVELYIVKSPGSGVPSIFQLTHTCRLV